MRKQPPLRQKSHKNEIQIKKAVKIYHTLFFYIPWLIKEMLISAFCLAKLALCAKNLRAKTLYLESFEDSEIGDFIYAQSITLTPGTLTLDIKPKNILVSYLIKPDVQNTNMKQKIENILC